MTTDTATTTTPAPVERTTAWTRHRRKPLKHREESSAYIDGFYVSANIDEYSRRWFVSGMLAGLRATLSGELPDGASLADLEQAAADAVVIGRAAGMDPR